MKFCINWKNVKGKFSTFLLTTSLLLTTGGVSHVFAQAPCEDECAGLTGQELDDCLNYCDGDVTDIPLNGYVFYLILVGVLLGVYSIMRLRYMFLTKEQKA